MQTKLLLILIICFSTLSGFTQENSVFEKWSWLIGEWQGEGGGQPGQGGGTFSFKTDLEGKIMVRKSHSEYPASGNRPATIHDDLMIVSLDYSGNPTKAIYFDNEGHTINYTIAYALNTIVLTSEKIPNVPTFRLTYTLLENQIVNTKFEMSQDGVKFMTYVEGKSRKIN